MKTIVNGMETVGYILTGSHVITTDKQVRDEWKLTPFTEELVTRTQAENVIESLKLSLERLVRNGQKQNWNDRYPEDMVAALEALDLLK